MFESMNARPHILIIDSDLDTLNRCETLLCGWATTIISNCDSNAAMRVFQECAPDIVLTEIVMPQMCGLGLLLDIKRISPQTKIIAMSADSSKLTADYVLYLASRLGADGVLSKPVDAGQFLKVIHALLFTQSHPPKASI